MSRVVRVVGFLAVVAGVVIAAAWAAPKEAALPGVSERYAALLEQPEGPRAEGALVRPASVLASRAAQPAASEPETAELVAPVEGIVIPAIGVVALIVEMGLTPEGAMDVPNSPDLVAWYGFTAKPGMGGNAVMSAHVDYVGRGPAVFWNLKELRPGDTIEVRLRDGAVIAYEVTASQSYAVEDVPMAEVVAPTAEESLTLITCGGTFVDGEYTHRLVVRAVRIAP